MNISIISPVYMAAGIIDELVNKIKESVSKITSDFEIILIEDGSIDGSWEGIERNCKKDKRVKGIKLSRNFGQHLALTAGLTYAKGDYVVVIDCDLQDNPEYIPELYEKVKEGYDIVYARRKKRNHNSFKDITAFVYYKFLSLISEYDFDPNIGSFSIINRKVVNSFLRLNDYKSGYLGLLKWLGYKYAYIEVGRSDRYTGKSSYTLKKLFDHASRLTVSYSNRLLLLAIYMGILFSALSFIGILYLFYQYFFVGYRIGWTSIMIMISFVGGIIMLLLGILGLYIGAIFDQVKSRPLFLVEQALNTEEEMYAKR